MNILEGKKLLIAEDETDVIETLKDLLGMCEIDSAVDFHAAEELLNKNRYDVAILDIMGVDGYKLLEIATQNEIPALMLTANALSPENFAKSISQGAKAYIPKEKMVDIAIYLKDLLEAQEGKVKPNKWYMRLQEFFDNHFGRNWKEDSYEIRKIMDEFEYFDSRGGGI